MLPSRAHGKERKVPRSNDDAFIQRIHTCPARTSKSFNAKLRNDRLSGRGTISARSNVFALRCEDAPRFNRTDVIWSAAGRQLARRDVKDTRAAEIGLFKMQLKWDTDLRLLQN